jgi:hypothetical protein
MVTKGSADQTEYFYIVQDDSNTSPGEPLTGLDHTDLTSASYMRQGGARVAITPLSTLAAADSAHADGGFKEVDATNMPGVYRFDPPDAAYADIAGVDKVLIHLAVTAGNNGVAAPVEVDLIAADLQDAGDLGLTIFAGITSLANWLGAIAAKHTANATALTEINATGAGAGTYDEADDSQEAQADALAVVDTNVQDIETATTTIDGILDQLKDVIILDDGLSVLASPASTTTSIKTDSSRADNYWNGALIVVRRAAGTECARHIKQYNNTNGEFVVDLMPFAPTDADTIYIVAVDVKNAADDSAEGFHLDHLLAVATPGGVPVADTIFDDIMGPSFSPATDNLEVIYNTVNANTLLIADVQSRLPAALVGARMDCSVGAVQADAITAAGIASDVTTELRSLVSGQADSGGASSFVDAARTEADTDYWKGAWVLFTSGAVDGQVRLITGFTPGTDTVTFTPDTTQSVGTNTYEILPANAVSVGEMLDNVLDADALATSAADEIRTGLATATALSTLQSDVTDISGRIPDILVAGAIKAHVMDFASGVIDSDAIADSAITKLLSLASGTATGGSSTTLVDTSRGEASDYWNGSRIVFTSGSNAGVSRLITDYDGGTDTFTFTPAVPVGSISAGDDYHVRPWAAVDVAWWRQTQPNVLASGRVDATVGAMANNVITEDVLAATAIAEIQNGLASSAIEAEIDDIKAALILIKLEVAATSTTTLVKTDADEADDFYNGLTLVVIDTAGEAVARAIDDYANTDGAFTVETLPFTPDALDVAYVVGRATNGGAGGAPSAAENADAVLEELIADHDGVAGSLAEHISQLKDIQVLEKFTAVAAGSSTSVIITNANRADNYFNDLMIVVRRAAGTETARHIKLYEQNGGAGKFTVDLMPFVVADGDEVYIVSASGRHACDDALEDGGYAKTGDAMDLIADAVDATSLADAGADKVRDAILADSNPFNGADIATILADTAAVQPQVDDLYQSTIMKKFTLTTGSVIGEIREGTTGEANQYYRGVTVVVKDVSEGLYASRRVENYQSTNGRYILEEDLPFTPEVGVDLVWVVSERLGRLFEMVGDNAVTNPKVGSWVDRMINKDGVQSYSQATMSQEALSERLPAALVGGRMVCDVTAVSGSATVADRIELDYDGTGYNRATSTIGTVTTLTGHTPQTGDNFARLGAPAGLSVSADVAAVKADTATLLGRVTAALFSGITSLANWLGAMAAKHTPDSTAVNEINATGGGSGSYAAADDAQEAIRDQGDDAWTTAAGFSTLDAQGVRNAQGLASTGGTATDSVDDKLDDLETQIAALNNLNQAGVQAALTAQGYTSGRAPKLDQLDESVAAVLAAVNALENLSSTQVATAIAADPGLIRVIQRTTNRVSLNPVNGVVTVYNDAGAAVLTGLAYLDVNQTQLYDGTGPVHSVTRLT